MERKTQQSSSAIQNAVKKAGLISEMPAFFILGCYVNKLNNILYVLFWKSKRVNVQLQMFSKYIDTVAIRKMVFTILEQSICGDICSVYFNVLINQK